jgi:DNA-directed RNA polymerase subunit beta'
MPVTITFQVGAIITVLDGQQISSATCSRVCRRNRPRRATSPGACRALPNLFEARTPKDAGMLAEFTGTMSFGKDTKGKQRLVITDLDGATRVPDSKDKHVLVHDGQVVNKGESIVDGAPDPHDILRLQGVEALAVYITDEVQDVYRLQGVKINDKHIEVIVRQMLRRVIVSIRAIPSSSRASRSSVPICSTRTTAWRPKASCRRPTSMFCWALPRLRCPPIRSFRRRPSRKRRVC